MLSKLLFQDSAPAFVDCTKCDTPIAAPANNNPGPSFFTNAIFLSFM
jgi:hypothetical protein